VPHTHSATHSYPSLRIPNEAASTQASTNLAGTAVGVCPVGSLTYQGHRTAFGDGTTPGKVCQSLYDTLIGIQTKQKADVHGWVVPLKKVPEVVEALKQEEAPEQSGAD
jgi:hypothetical protein